MSFDEKRSDGSKYLEGGFTSSMKQIKHEDKNEIKQKEKNKIWNERPNRCFNRKRIHLISGELNNERKNYKQIRKNINQKHSEEKKRKEFEVLQEASEYFESRVALTPEQLLKEEKERKEEREIIETLDFSEDICIICKEKNGIYKCPNCSRRTCSVGCFKKHKKENICKVEKKKQFQVNTIHKENLNEANLYKDYLFLERIHNVIQGNYNFFKMKSEERSKIWLTKQNILNRILKSRNLRLTKAPLYTKLHKENTTYISKNTIHWKIYCTFGNEHLFFKKDGISEYMKIWDLIQFSCEKIEHLAKKLKMYLQNPEYIHVFLYDPLKLQKIAEPTYSVNHSILEILKDKEICEFPHLYLELIYNDNNELLRNAYYDVIDTKEKQVFVENTIQNEKNQIS